MRSRLLSCVVAASVLVSASCVMMTKYAVETDRSAGSRHVAKVHLKDGSVAIFRTGFSVAGQNIEGTYTRYDLARFLPASLSTAPLPLDSVLGVVSYPRRLQIGPLVASAALLGAAPACLASALYDPSPQNCSGLGPFFDVGNSMNCHSPAVLLGIGTSVRGQDDAPSASGQEAERALPGPCVEPGEAR